VKDKAQTWMLVYADTHRPDGHRVKMNRYLPWPPKVPCAGDSAFYLEILRAVVSRRDRGMWFKGDTIHWRTPLHSGSALFEQTAYNGAEVSYQLIIDGRVAASATLKALELARDYAKVSR
jgi:hypothetical protein